jgi:hypothetical protein
MTVMTVMTGSDKIVITEIKSSRISGVMHPPASGRRILVRERYDYIRNYYRNHPLYISCTLSQDLSW